MSVHAISAVGRPFVNELTLLASAARTASGNTDGDEFPNLGEFQNLVFQLDVTAAATDADDTLDVVIQTTIDGTNWFNVLAFTQVLGNGGAKRHIGKINAGAAQAMFEASASLAAGSVRNVTGGRYRVAWTIVDTDEEEDQSFTSSVFCNAI